MIIAKLETEDGKLINVITLMPKQFSTGSKGFLGLGQVVVDGKRHQVTSNSLRLVAKKGNEVNAAQYISRHAAISSSAKASIVSNCWRNSVQSW